MGLTEYVAVLAGRWRVLAAVTLATLLGAVVLGLAAGPEHRASTRVFLSVQVGGTAGDLARGGSVGEGQARALAALATQPLVLDPVARELRLAGTGRDLAPSVVARVPRGTVLVEVLATSPSPARASAVADAVARRLVQVAAELSPRLADGRAAVRATAVAPRQDARPVGASPRLHVAVALLLGPLLGAALAVHLDARARRAASTQGDRA